MLQLASELAALAAAAADNRLTPADVAGSTFSISNIGTMGGTYATPLVNSPEVQPGRRPCAGGTRLAALPCGALHLHLHPLPRLSPCLPAPPRLPACPPGGDHGGGARAAPAPLCARRPHRGAGPRDGHQPGGRPPVRAWLGGRVGGLGRHGSQHRWQQAAVRNR